MNVLLCSVILSYHYLSLSLGLVSESPMTVQLHFEPAGRPGEDREYYLREKENICAVCGTDKNCVRKNIVPHEYRRSVAGLGYRL